MTQNKFFRFSRVLILMMILFLVLTTLAVAVGQENAPEAISLSQVRYVGPFTNTTNGYGGSVLIDIDVEPTAVSGFINFTNGPDVPGVLCGAGSFSGTRSGNTLSFSFVSNDPEPGCTPYNGITFNISGDIAANEIVNGSFSVPSLGQSGVFYAKQTIRSNGRFDNGSLTLDGDVYADLAYWDNSIAGYINFTGDPEDPALCGANSFTGTRNGTALTFSFLSSDYDAGCTIMDDKRFNVTANMSAHSLTDGAYYVPFYGQGGTFWTNGPASDGTPPGGNVTSPTNGATIGVGTHTISANAADNDGGVGVSYVNFWVRYDGSWHFISTDPTPPYSAQWSTPGGLQTQLIRFAIDVVDKQGNWSTTAGGTVPIYFVESSPDIQQNLLPPETRAYLNQRSLSPVGDLKCGAASAAMVLAMNGRIGRDYNSMASTANAIYQHLNPIVQVTNSLRNYNLNASYACRTPDNAWNLIKSEIDAGRPTIVLSSRVTTVGHYFVVVGYREEGNNRRMTVYDPYGSWIGTSEAYYPNSISPDSYIGRSAYYDFNAAWGYSSQYCNNGSGYLITAVPRAGFKNIEDVSLFPIIPDEVSDEPRVQGTYNGIEVVTEINVYLPVVIRP